MLLALIAWLGCLPAAALADGDPASDVLVSQNAFVPSDAPSSTPQLAGLAGTLRAAATQGYPIRVAVISSPSDLGSVSELWGQPQNYARFLGAELSLVYPGRVLVVMPQGVGLYHRVPLLAGERTALSSLHATGRGDLVPRALGAVQRLAAAAGHRLPTVNSTPGQGGQAGSGSISAMSWLVIGAGVLLIVVSWTASLRARPLQVGRRSASAG